MPSSSVGAYTGGAKGFVRERDIRQRRYLPSLSVGAEAADVIAVTIAMTTFREALNDYVQADEAIQLECYLVDENGLESVLGDFTLAATTGVEISTTAMPRLLLSTTSAGIAVLNVEDINAGSDTTIHLFVKPLNVPGFPGYVQLTFD